MSDELVLDSYAAVIDAGYATGEFPISCDSLGKYHVWIGEPPAPWQQEIPPSRIISAQEYADRFTGEERGLFVALVESGDAVAKQLHESVLARIALDQGVDLDSPRVSAGLDYLISKGVILPARKAEILQ